MVVIAGVFVMIGLLAVARAIDSLADSIQEER